MGIDGSNNVHISYYDESNGDMKYAMNTGGGWSIDTVDSEGSVGSSCTLALDDWGNAHVSYYSYDPPSRGLKYATNAGGNWMTEIVYSVGGVGYISTAVGHEGIRRKFWKIRLFI